MRRSIILIALAAALCAADACSAAGPGGFIHGTVALRDSTTHTGFLRWRDEEAFWDDLFESRKREQPWREHVDMDALKKEREQRYFAEHGLLDRLIWSISEARDEPRLRRLFTARFGDLARLDIPRDNDDDVVVTMRDGSVFPVRGYANDVSSDILVHAGGGAPLEFDWDELESITFTAAPAGGAPPAGRLYGVVTWGGGSLTGFIQWDLSECTTADFLDYDGGDTPMGDIRSITRNGRGGSDLELTNGERMSVDGSNDVARGNRGVVVAVDGLGRVTVPWERFEKVVFADPPDSGPAYADFSGARPLQGTAVTTDGERLTGRIVYDADEAATWDIFSGSSGGCDYEIPFQLIRGIEPLGPDGCRVTLAGGRVLELADHEDTGRDHAGVLVFAGGDAAPRHIPWSRLLRLDLQP